MTYYGYSPNVIHHQTGQIYHGNGWTGWSAGVHNSPKNAALAYGPYTNVLYTPCLWSIFDYKVSFWLMIDNNSLNLPVFFIFIHTHRHKHIVLIKLNKKKQKKQK